MRGTCIFSTHEVDLAARTADDAVLLARGAVLASGPVRSFRVERARLEDVFLRLTGRHSRD